MLNIVVPMAGRGSRFATEGYKLPKPLIDVRGVPMIQLAMANLQPQQPHRFVFLCLEDHLKQFPTERILREISPDCKVIAVGGVTQGAACTVLLAKEYINTSNPLMVVNSDQWVDIDVNAYLAKMQTESADGLIMTMKAADPKWSFVRFAESGQISEVVEKQVVSNEATVGVYNFNRGDEFVAAAEEMIAKDLRVNNEFYLAPSYNMLISQGKKITHYNIGEVGAGMYGLGTPADLEAFLADSVCDRAIAIAKRSINQLRAA